jgi:hypothetical protein
MANESGQKQLSILLKLTDQLSSGLSGKTIPTLKKFQAESKATLSSYEKLRSALGKPLPTGGLDKYTSKIRSAAKDVKAFGTEQAKLGNRISKPISSTGLDAQISKLKEYRTTLNSTATASDKLRNSMRGRQPSGLPKDPLTDDSLRRRRSTRQIGSADRLERAGDLIQGGRQVAALWRDRADSLSEYVDEATRLLRAQEQFKALNFSETDNAKAFSAITKTVKDLKGVSLTDTTETLQDLTIATGSLGHAIESLPLASKYRRVFSTLYGDKFSSEEIENQIRSSFKFLESTGSIARGPKQMDEMFDVMTRMTAATSGRLSPAEMLQLSRRAGPSIQGLSATGLQNLTLPLQELSGSGTGVALMAAYRSLVTGVMKQPSKEEFQRLGLIDPTKIEYGRAQQIKNLKPGANLLGPLMMEDPLKAADSLMEAMKKHGIDTSNQNKVREELGLLFQNKNAFTLMSLLTTQRGQVVKDAGISQKTKGLTGLDEQLSKSPLMKITEYKAAMTNLRAEIGQGIVPLITMFAEKVTPIARFFAEYPNVAKWGAYVLIGGKALLGLTETFSILKASRSLDFFVRTQSEASNVANALGSADRRALGLKGSLESLPKSIQIGLVLGAAWFTLQRILDAVSAFNEKNAAEKQLNVITAGRVNDVKKVEAAYAKTGEKVPQREYKLFASSAFSALNVDRQLEYYLNPDLESSSHRAAAYGTNRLRDIPSDINNKLLNNPKFLEQVGNMPGDYGVNLKQQLGIWSAAAHINERAPLLGNANVMTQFRGLIAGGNYSDEAKTTFNEELAKAFPDSFRQSSAMIVQQYKETGQALSFLIPKVTDSGQAFNQATNAARNFAADVNAIQLPSVIGGLAGLAGGTIQTAPNVPKSAIGSIIRSNGLVNLHRGNVVFPASLSRRSPGDWLQSASALSDAWRGQTMNSGGVNVGGISIQVQAHPDATRDPQVLAAQVTQAIRENFAEHLWAHEHEIERIMVARYEDGRARS